MDKRNRIWNKEHRVKIERMRRRTEGDGNEETGFGTRNCRAKREDEEENWREMDF